MGRVRLLLFVLLFMACQGSAVAAQSGDGVNIIQPTAAETVFPIGFLAKIAAYCTGCGGYANMHPFITIDGAIDFDTVLVWPGDGQSVDLMVTAPGVYLAWVEDGKVKQRHIARRDYYSIFRQDGPVLVSLWPLDKYIQPLGDTFDQSIDCQTDCPTGETLAWIVTQPTRLVLKNCDPIELLPTVVMTSWLDGTLRVVSRAAGEQPVYSGGNVYWHIANK